MEYCSANKGKLMEKVKKIAKFHEDYKREFLRDRIQKKDHYLKDPKEALFLILSYSFYQGRKDELSLKFEKSAKQVLDQLDTRSILLSSKSRIVEKAQLEEEYREIYKELEKMGVRKGGDRLMVISFINLIQSSEEKNILSVLINEIKSGSTQKAHSILDSVWSVGEKIASLILRDTVYIYGLESYLKKPGDYYYLQPIDTWVHKLSRAIGLIDKEDIYKNEAKDITNKCFELEVNPIHYNQGAWYMGTHSLEILLRNIEYIK